MQMQGIVDIPINRINKTTYEGQGVMTKISPNMKEENEPIVSIGGKSCSCTSYAKLISYALVHEQIHSTADLGNFPLDIGIYSKKYIFSLRHHFWHRAPNTQDFQVMRTTKASFVMLKT